MKTVGIITMLGVALVGISGAVATGWTVEAAQMFESRNLLGFADMNMRWESLVMTYFAANEQLSGWQGLALLMVPVAAMTLVFGVFCSLIVGYIVFLDGGMQGRQMAPVKKTAAPDPEADGVVSRTKLATRTETRGTARVVCG